MDDSDKIRRILRTSRTMQEHGYRVIPVNPSYDTILGEKTCKKVTNIPEKVDIVDCFRKGSERSGF